MTKPLMCAAVAVTICWLMGCAPARTRPGDAADLSAIRKQLSESETKIEELTQQVALIQMMVDSHQRTLQDFENAKTTAAATAPAQPAAPAAKTGGAPPVVQAAPAEPAQVAKQIEPDKSPKTEERLIVPEPNPLYQEAMSKFRNGDFETAAGLFEAFAKKFPKDDLADNALYWSGECRYTRKDFAAALKRFKQVVEAYPSGSKMPDALLKIGYTYISLGDKQSAETYLKKVIEQYPFSSAGAKAEERLKALEKE